jgi:EmrB/QacA subfamily drug resistance transporter
LRCQILPRTIGFIYRPRQVTCSVAPSLGTMACMSSYSPRQKRVLLVSILASFVSFLDGFIVNVALPAIGRDLGGGLTAQQWIVNAYLLTLGSLMLLAGSLSDIFGRERILTVGLIGFGAASILCALAPNAVFLEVMRAFQGAAGALLVPSSLALIMANFSGGEEGSAIGMWTSWTVVAAVIGPLVGGFLVDAISWRSIFGINVLPIGLVLWLMRPLAPAPRAKGQSAVDGIGALLGALGLGAVMCALIEEPHRGWASPLILPLLVSGLLALGIFVWYEHQAAQPMLPVALFANGNFRVGNIATVLIYGGLSVSTFLVTIFVQEIGGYSALAAGLTFLPVTALMFLLSSYVGQLAGRYGPRLFMSTGPMVAGVGFLLMLRLDEAARYWTDLFPGVLLLGLGLALTVAPLTTAILGAIDKQQAGIASAVNNAASRLAGLVAIAVIGIIAGPRLTVAGFHAALWFIAALLFAGGVVSAVGITNPSDRCR